VVSKSREQIVKEQRIVRLVRQGVSKQRAADMFGLTDRRIRQICEDWRDVPSVSVDEIEVDARAVIRTIEQLELLCEEHLVLASSTSQDGVKLGALRDYRETLILLMQLRAEAGLIPRPLASANLQQEFVGLVRGVVDALRRQGADEDVVRTVLAFAEDEPKVLDAAVAA
jgi:hypothetical protein